VAEAMRRIGVPCNAQLGWWQEVMSLLARCISFFLVRIVGHSCVLEAAITCRAISLFHALGTLSIAAGRIELL